MKKTKKLLALMMVLATLLSVLAIPAAAAIKQETDPLVMYHRCARCDGDATSEEHIYHTEFFTVSNPNYCYNGVLISHTHVRYYAALSVTCNNCGRYDSENYTYTACLG